MKIKLKAAVLAITMACGIGMAIPATTNAIDVWGSCSGTNTNSQICKDKGQQIEPLISNIIRVIIFIAGAIAVIMIIIGGIRYVVSGGDAGQVTSAKNTILYAVVGLVVVIMAYAIVAFVLKAI